MENMLADAADHYDTVRREHLAETVTYTRTATSVSLAATQGDTRYEAQTESGLTVRAKTTDFIIRAGDLVIGGIPTTPIPGDEVRVTRGSTIVVYEVQNFGDGGCWRPCDSRSVLIRIHARQTGTESAP